jgi:hypothetical protein
VFKIDTEWKHAALISPGQILNPPNYSEIIEIYDWSVNNGKKSEADWNIPKLTSPIIYFRFTA